MGQSAAIFFDLGETLASPRFDANGGIAALDVFPFVPEVLDRIRSSAPGTKLGLMSNTPDGVSLPTMRTLLGAAGILERFDPKLLLFSSVEGVGKDQAVFFQRGASRADMPASRCIFVGEAASERAVAESAGFRVSYHPLHVFSVLGKMT